VFVRGCEWVVRRCLFFVEGVGKSEINIASSLVLSFFLKIINNISRKFDKIQEYF
jgi:hypothetical protein